MVTANVPPSHPKTGTSSAASATDLRSREVSNDAHAVYGRIRDESPVCWNDSLGGWLLTRHADVRDALRDDRLSVEKLTPFAARHAHTADAQVLSAALSDWMVFADPPRNQQLRRAMQGSFLARDAPQLEHAVRRVVDELLAPLECGAETDLVHSFALPLPAIVILELFGMPRDEGEQMRRWSDELGRFVLGARQREDLHARAASAVRAMRKRFQALLAEHRRAPRDDFTSQLIRDGQGLSDDELTHTLMLVLFAGHETTTNLIASAVLQLARDASLFQKLRDDRALLANAIEEFLRLDSPVELLLRIALQDLDYGGKTIRAGERLFLILNSANRDPAAFDTPDELQLHGTRSRHLAFGPGVHMCMGAPLARLVTRVALDGLLERFSSIELVGSEDSNTDGICWREELMVHGPRTLPMRLKRTGKS